MIPQNRFCLPYVSPGVSFVCTNKILLEKLNEHVDVLAPLIARSKSFGYDNWRIFVQKYTKDIPARFLLRTKNTKNNKKRSLWRWLGTDTTEDKEVLLEFPVYSLADFGRFEHYDIICCSDMLAPVQFLEKSGKHKSVFFLAPTSRILRGFQMIERRYEAHEEKIHHCARMLKTPEDVQLLNNTVFPIKTRSFTHSTLSAFPEYFHPLTSPQKGDVVISGGVSANATVELQLCRTVGSEGKVYAFEPDPDGVRGAEEFFRQYPDVSNIEIVPLGLWNKAETVTFVSGLEYSSYVKHSSESCRSAEKHKTKKKDTQMNKAKEIQVRMTTIDRFVQERGLGRLDYIKLDIEGSELAAIQGARETFLRFAPRFAICIYHRPEDVWTIPQFFKSLEDEGVKYELYFGVHSLGPFSDKILDTIGPFQEMILYGKPV